MGVYINDFEVAVEPSPAPAGDTAATDGQQAASTASAGPTPEDVRRIARRHEERQCRIWAH